MSAGNVAEQPGNSVVEDFRDLPTAAVSDALDRLGLVGCCEGILPLDFGLNLVGRAVTVRYRPVGEVDRGTVGDYIDDVEPGSIVVLDNAGRTDCTVWGDILTAVATRRGIGGTVINGVCRDVAWRLNSGMACFLGAGSCAQVRIESRWIGSTCRFHWGRFRSVQVTC